MTTNKAPEVNLRNIVLNMLLENNKGRLSHLIVKDTLDENKNLDKNQRAFITRLFQGTIERTIEEDYIINLFSKTKVNKMKPVIRYILRMSVYQLKYMDSVPESAVCNEAVKLAKKRKFSNLKGFVNGVVRNIARNMDSIKYPEKENERLEIEYSMPLWIVDMWIERFGIETTKNILKSVYNKKTTTIRVNTSKTTVDEVVVRLENEGAKVKRSTLYSNALEISDYNQIADFYDFNKGNIVVQNLSSMFVGMAANPKEGDYIIDVCAAPGGKSLHIADLIHNKGKIRARDLTEYKVGLINENIKRTGFNCIFAECKDATKLDKNVIGKADIVIADLPCSGLGVIGNKVDIKYNTSIEQINELAKLQKEILSVVSKYVKPGGTLIYSTCTVTKEENEDNVKWIEENLPFKLQSLNKKLPEQIIDNKHDYVQILPGKYGMDGFFISAFRRIDK